MKSLFGSIGRKLWRIFLVILSAPFLVIKMAITDVKEEASDIERASNI